MPFQSATPLAIDDFSGGITENYLQGDPRRSRYFDNFYLTVDKSLQMRNGIIPYDFVNYVFPNSTGQRISGLYFWMTEKIFFGQTGKKIFVMDPNTTSWIEMSGLNGVDALSGGDAHSQTSYAEFQRQVYLTNDGIDGNGSLPTKIYQDVNNLWRAKTVGLPRAWVPGTYTTASLLAQCIYNANAIAQSMIAHFQDAQSAASGIYTSGTAGKSDGLSLHLNVDKYSLSYLQAVTFTGTIIPSNITGYDPEMPSPLPTPISSATTQATLFQLVTALNAAFTHHITEASSGSSLPISTATQQTSVFYHQRSLVNTSANTAAAGAYIAAAPPSGPHALLNASAAPTTVAQAAAMLDDILQKWNWHRGGIWVHSPTNDSNFTNKYAPLCTAIGTTTTGNSTPVVTPDYTDVLNYVSNIGILYNGHVSNNISPFNSVGGSQAHGQNNNARYALDLAYKAPAITDLNSAYLSIYWLRCLWFCHERDAAVPVQTGITFTGNSTTSITSVKGTASTVNVVLNVGSFVVLPPSQGITFVNGSYKAMVTASGSGTATLDLALSGGTTGITGQNSASVYHLSLSSVSSALALTDITVSIEQATDALTTPVNSLGIDTPSWLILAGEMFYALQSHAVFSLVHLPNYTTTTFASYITNLTNPFYIPSVSNVSYAFYFSDSYTVQQNGIQYLVRGNPTISASTQVAVSYPLNYTIPSATPTVYPSIVNYTTRANALSGLPVLINQQNTNYDTANAMLNIYRTINGGQTYFLVAQVPNGTTTYSDTTNDSLASTNGSAALINSQSMYTTGGTVGSDQPAVSKFIHIFSGSVYYAGITDTGQLFPQQIRQSVQFAPDWAPATFSDNLDDDITGISSTKSNVVAFCKNSTYRMSGGFSQTGQGALTHDRIADVIGSLNMKGIVKTEIGIFFPGNDGFYYTDGYQVIKISLELDKTYLSLTQSAQQQRAITGCYDKSTRRVHWSMMANPNDADNSVTYVFYLDYGVKPSGVFTTTSNFTNYAPASMVFSQGVQYIGHRDGYILKSDFNTKYDYVLSSASIAAGWYGQYIPYNWTSVAVDMGTTFKRKYLTTFNVSGNNLGNVLAQPSVIKDLNQTGIGALNLSEINYADNIIWGDARCVWGDVTRVWKTDGKLDVFRRFPRKSLRSDYVQFSLQPAFGALYSSSNNYPVGANANVNSTLKTATIITPSGYTAIQWFPDIIGAQIFFQSDGYVQGYTIVSLTSSNTVITYIDVSNLSFTSSSSPWVIRGYKLNQRPNITSIAIGFVQNGSHMQVYPGSSSVSGPGNGGENPS